MTSSRQMLNQRLNFNARAKKQSVTNMNRHIDVQFRSGLQLGLSKESPNMLVLQCLSMLYVIHTTLSAISKLRFHTTLTLLVALQTGLGQCRHAGLLCAPIATAMLPFSEGLFRSCELTANFAFRDSVGGVDASISAECVRGHD